MTALITMIYDTLKTLGTVYFEEAPQDIAFPFIVFRFPTSIDGISVGAEHEREDFILEVDIWADTKDTTALEALTTSVDTALHRKHYVGQFYTNIYRVNRMMIPDPEFKRRQLRYQCKTYL